MTNDTFFALTLIRCRWASYSVGNHTWVWDEKCICWYCTWEARVSSSHCNGSHRWSTGSHLSLLDLLQQHSSTQKLLQVPFLSTDFGRCALSYSSPATWNSILTSIKNCSSLYLIQFPAPHEVSQTSSLTINTLRPATWRLPALPIHA